MNKTLKWKRLVSMLMAMCMIFGVITPLSTVFALDEATNGETVIEQDIGLEKQNPEPEKVTEEIQNKALTGAEDVDNSEVIWRSFKSGATNDNGAKAAILQLTNSDAQGIKEGSISFTYKPKSTKAETRLMFSMHLTDAMDYIGVGHDLSSNWFYEDKKGGVYPQLNVTAPEANSENNIAIKFKGKELWVTINNVPCNSGNPYTLNNLDTHTGPIAFRIGTWGKEVTDIQFKDFKVTKVENGIESVVVSNNNDKWKLIANQNGEIFDEGKPLSFVNVNGKVTDKEGLAIEGASVSIDEKTLVMTNNEGTFSLSDVATGSYTLNVKKQGYINYSKEITVYENDLDLENVVLGTPEALNIDFSNFIETDDMKVAIDTTFPRVIGYEMKKLENKRMYGQTDTLNVIRINNVAVTPTITSTVSTDKTAATYIITVKDDVNQIDAVITAQLKAVKNTLEFKVTDIKNNIANSVKTIFIPNHNLISARSNQMDANLDGANMSVDVSVSGDTHSNVGLLPLGNKGYMCAFVSADGLSAGVYSNSSSNTIVTGSAQGDWQQITASTTTLSDGIKNAGISSSAWTYQRGANYKTEEMPLAKVIITGDKNDDNTVDWQDGAIAYRDIMNNPVGSEKVPDMVAWRICMNFSGQASNPFLMALDNVKKVYLHTDGLGQSVLLKGYGSEGHDSGHLDYADIGKRIGGAEDMKTLLHEGGLLGANFGVHVNASETYPESKYFTDDRLKKDAKGNYSYGWNWLDQGVNIDADYDLRNGRADRFKDFYDALGGENNELDYIYVDVWGNGQSGDNGSWASRQLAREIQKLNWAVSGEWGYAFADDSIFQHWASDLTYGGANLKGVNSEIFRFIRNHQKDSWVGDYPSYGGAAVNPLLGGNDMKDFEGWQGRNDYNGYITNLFEDNLPTKFVQHHKVMKWVDGTSVQLQGANWTPEKEITLNDDKNTLVISRKSMDPKNIEYQKRTMKYNDKIIMDGDQYLIPWSWDANGNKLAETEEKLYHYNETSAESTTTWELPESWKSLSDIKMYTLTETGKQKEQTIAVVDGKVTLKALSKTPYVIHRGAKANLDVKWSEHMHVVDGNFNSANLNAWTITGEKAGVSLVKSTGSLDMLTFANTTGEVALTQDITDLKPGVKYAAYVGVDNRSDAKAYIEVNANGITASNYTQKSIAPNYISSYAHNNNAPTFAGSGSKFQNMYVFFTAPATGKTTLTLRREMGNDKTYMDDIRILENSSVDMYVSNNKFLQGFEDVPQGLFPFVVGGVEGVTDNRSHLSQKHEPYTKQGWNDVAISDVVTGDWAVKTNGLVRSSNIIYQTIPQNYRFEAGKTYNVQFDYASGSDDTYALIIGNGEYGTTQCKTQIIPLKGNPYKPATTYKFRLTGDDNGQSWFGIYSTNTAANTQGVTGAKATFCGFESFVLDNLLIQQSDVSKAELEKAINENSGLYKENYSEITYQLYTSTLNSAKTVLDNFDATQVEVENAKNALLNSVKNLVAVAGTVRGKAEISYEYYGTTYKYPVSDVEVSIKLPDGKVTKGKTDSEGNYLIQGVSFGKGQLIVDDSKYIKYTADVEISKDKPSVEANVLLKEATSKISGKVIAFNKPVANAEVSVEGSSESYRATTNDKGEYTFDNVIAGSYKVLVSCESFENYIKYVFAGKTVPLTHDIILEPKSEWDYTNNYDDGVVAWDNLAGNTLSTTIRAKDSETNILFSNGYSNVYETNAPRFKDGCVEMDITTKSSGLRMGIMLRGNSMDERIYVGVGDGVTDYFAEHYTDGDCTWTDMHPGEAFAANKKMHLKAEIVDKTVTLWVNGEKVLTETLENVHVKEGHFGLSTRRTHDVLVDNVKVVSYDPPTENTRNIIGKVTQEGNAIQGAEIVLKKANTVIKTVNSDTYGYFKLKNIPYGEYKLEVKYNGQTEATKSINLVNSTETFVLTEIDFDNETPVATFATIFNVDGKETLVTTNVGEAIVMPTNPTKDGYTFDGWFTAATAGIEVIKFTSAQTVYAQWNKITTPPTPSNPTNGGGSYNPPIAQPVAPPVVTQTTGKTYVTVATPAISETMTTNEKTVAKAEIQVDKAITDKATATNPVQIKTELPTADVKSAIENSLTKQVEIKLTVPNAVATSKNVLITEIKADKSIFEQAKTSGKEIVLKVETADGKLIASWSFDGTKIANTAVDVNLAVNLVKATTLPAINKAGASAATKPLVVSFEHSGNLPATAKVTLDVSTDYNNGDNLFLYYFNVKTKKLELISKDNKVVDGKVTIAISHCSDYVLTKTAVSATAATKTTTNSKAATSVPKTGDTTPIGIVFVLAITACACIVLRRKLCK